MSRGRIAAILSGLLVLGVAVGVGLAFLLRDDAGTAADSTTTTAAEESTTTAESTTTEPTTTSSTTTTTEPATTTTAAQEPEIISFQVPATAACPGTTEITISWSTSNAATVFISIDGPGKFEDLAAAGTKAFPFNCDGNPHTYTLTAQSPGKPDAVRTETVQPSP